MTIFKCAQFPRDEVFYLFPFEHLRSVANFQKQRDRLLEDFSLHPRSYQVALTWLAAAGKLSVAKEIVALLEPSYLEYGDTIGRTPLIWGVVKGQCAMVKYLISAKANVNTTSGDGRTPLWFAAKTRRVRLVEILLECGGVAQPELDESREHLIERAQVALSVERKSQEAFCKSLLSLLNTYIPNTGDAVNKIIMEYTDPLMKG